MSIEKMREEFEAWVLHRAKDTPMRVYPALLERYADEPCDYRQSWVDSAWQSWQASRAALVIEVPKVFPDDSVSRVCAKYAEAIEAAGVKVHP